MNPIRVAILGTGNIGTDLCYRMLLDPRFEVVALVGRRPDSPGLKMFEGKVKHLLSSGIEGLIPLLDQIDGAFDATSAFDHESHWNTLSRFQKWVVDLTPSKIGTPIVPVLTNKISKMNVSENFSSNYSMVTCGGQSSAPLLYAIATASSGIREVEISSSIAALSAGPATRLNIDQYIDSTEGLASQITGCEKVKAILVLNPAEPPIMMRTTVSLLVDKYDLELANRIATEVVAEVKRYVPGYDLAIEPFIQTPNTISATVKVKGAGYVLPEYAGNLDIINSAAVELAVMHSNTNVSIK
jgi:acetaldehyde dehydrogenase